MKLVRVDVESLTQNVEDFRLDGTQIRWAWGFCGGDLVELNGEVLLLPAKPQEAETIMGELGLVMLKADLMNNAWEIVESLGDYVVIAGRNSSFSVLGDKVGVGRGDYMFFANLPFGIHWCKVWMPWVVYDLTMEEIGGGRFPKIPESDQIVF